MGWTPSAASRDDGPGGWKPRNGGGGGGGGGGEIGWTPGRRDDRR